MSLSNFCPICGRFKRHMISGVCSECYDDRGEAMAMAAYYGDDLSEDDSVETCKRCGRANDFKGQIMIDGLCANCQVQWCGQCGAKMKEGICRFCSEGDNDATH